jgi:hypothetical protein
LSPDALVDFYAAIDERLLCEAMAELLVDTPGEKVPREKRCAWVASWIGITLKEVEAAGMQAKRTLVSGWLHRLYGAAKKVAGESLKGYGAPIHSFEGLLLTLSALSPEALELLFPKGAPKEIKFVAGQCWQFLGGVSEDDDVCIKAFVEMAAKMKRPPRDQAFERLLLKIRRFRPEVYQRLMEKRQEEDAQEETSSTSS